VISYRQVIAAFPNGGGAYAVAKTYLGRRSSLVAAASLVIDYVLNVAVSVAAGTAALISAVPATAPYALEIALGVLALITAVNLRGIAASARAFIVPTAVFVVSILAMIVAGLFSSGHAAPPAASAHGLETVGALLLLKAFAQGCSALTGVEAIANAVPDFRAPRVKRAQRAELILGLLLGVMMLGIAVLIKKFDVQPRADVTILAQVTEHSLGRGIGYYVVQFATVILLALAANTSFGGLPNLMRVVACDHYLPQRLRRRTRRGVYRDGVLILAVASAILLIAADADMNALVPLFAIGVFIGFTLAQVGMVRHWLADRPAGWRRHVVINGAGAAATGVATVVVLAMKFFEGAWLVLVVLLVLIGLMSWVQRTYRRQNPRRVVTVQSAPRGVVGSGRRR